MVPVGRQSGCTCAAEDVVAIPVFLEDDLFPSSAMKSTEKAYEDVGIKRLAFKRIWHCETCLEQVDTTVVEEKRNV
jgi:hypothetical protein